MRPTRAENVSIRDSRGNARKPISDLSLRPSILPFRRPEIALDPRSRRLLQIAFAAWLVSVLLTVLLATMAMVAASGLPWRGFALIWIPMLVAILAAILTSNVAKRRANAHWIGDGRQATAMLFAARGQCPACAAWMLTTPPDADGLTTCPKCAAAWKVGNEGGCPGCGYDMSQVPATAGPLAICPECATLSAANLASDRPA